MFGINPLEFAEQELLKVDENHNGVPDAIEALGALKASTANIGSFLKYFDATDIEAILKLLPASVQAKIPATAIAAVSGELAAFPAQLATLQAELTKVEASLKTVKK